MRKRSSPILDHRGRPVQVDVLEEELAIERSDGRQLAATLRRDLAIPIVELNHGPQPAYPEVVIRREDAADVELVSKALERLVPLGLRVPADHVRSLLGLPEPANEDEVLQPPQPPGLAAGRDDPRRRGRAADEDAIDVALARALDDWRPLAEPAVAPLLDAARDALADGGGLPALRARLPALLDDMDDSAVAELLRRLSFSARLSGRLDPQPGDSAA